MDVLREMIELKRQAAHARCRIKAWRLTYGEMWRLAHGLCNILQSPISPVDLYEDMKAGKTSLFGARIITR